MVVTREEDGDAFLFHAETGALKAINATGLSLWRLCDDARSLQELVEHMAAAFPEEARDRIEADVRAYTGRLLEIGFLGRTEASDSEPRA